MKSQKITELPDQWNGVSYREHIEWLVQEALCEKKGHKPHASVWAAEQLCDDLWLRAMDSTLAVLLFSPRRDSLLPLDNVDNGWTPEEILKELAIAAMAMDVVDTMDAAESYECNQCGATIEIGRTCGDESHG